MINKAWFAALQVILCIFLFGCAADSDQTVPTTLPPQTDPQPTVVATAPPTTPPTEIPTTQPTVIDNSLHISPGSYMESFVDDQTGDFLDYYLHIPENALKGMPLIIFLHGDGEVGKVEHLENLGMIARAREIYGESFPFIAISPCTRIQSWTYGNTPTTLKALIDEMVNTYEIDTEHIIITGHSRGGLGVWHMVSRYGDFFSAAVPISCWQSEKWNIENCAKVPAWVFTGDVGAYEQEYIISMRSLIYQINDAGGQAQLTVLQGATHNMTLTDSYTLDTFLWMLEQ